MMERKKIEISHSKKAFELLISLIKTRTLGKYIWTRFKVLVKY